MDDTDAVKWKSVQGTSIPVPPQEHPRLFLRKEHIADLKRRMDHPVLGPARERMQRLADERGQYRADWNALHYLMGGDESLGRQAIAEIIDTMREQTWPGHEDHSAGNVSRPIGRMMVSGAVVYDWCYPLLTSEDRDAIRAEIVRHAELLECGYPPDRQGAVTGHSSEHMMIRDMIAAGIALYDEFPDMYDLSASRFFREHLPARNWFYPGHAYHQGESYGTYRYGADIYPTWMFDRLGVGNVYHPAQQFVPYQWIYMRRPDGQLLRQGDTYKHSAPKDQPWGTGDGGVLSASYYGDGYVLADWLHNTNINTGGDNSLFELLWRDPELQPRPCTDLPLSRYMGFPYGWMIARTGWDEACVIAEMRVNVYNFTNHYHLDAGSFQVYHKGPLAIDSGLYQGTDGGYGSPHNQNYYWRTIAHNSLLIYDPDEEWPQRRDGRPTRNEGGQRMPNNRREAATLDVLLSEGYKTGEVEGHWIGPDAHVPSFTYLKGDITEAYSQKVKEVKRSFAFINLHNADVPAALIVFDRVVSADGAFKKCWLLHCMEEPEVDGNRFTVSRTAPGERGKLVNTALLPEVDNLEMEAIGGPGKEFWVFGENFPNSPRGDREGSHELGAWRMQLSPKAPAELDCFLNVMQVMDRESGSPHPVHIVEGEGMVGARVADHAVLFSRSGQRLDESVSFDLSGTDMLTVLVTDLAEGTWQIWRDGEIIAPAVEVTADAGTLYLEGPGGSYMLRR